MFLFLSVLRQPRSTLFPYTTLFRSVFTWAGGEPTDEAVVPVQVHWPWIVAASAIAAIARVILRYFNFRSEEHTSELQSRGHLVCRLLLEKKKLNKFDHTVASKICCS